MLSHGNIISNIIGLRAVLPEDLVSCHDRSLSFLPWAHCEHCMVGQLNVSAVKVSPTDLLDGLEDDSEGNFFCERH